MITWNLQELEFWISICIYARMCRYFCFVGCCLLSAFVVCRKILNCQTHTHTAHFTEPKHATPQNLPANSKHKQQTANSNKPSNPKLQAQTREQAQCARCECECAIVIGMCTRGKLSREPRDLRSVGKCLYHARALWLYHQSHFRLRNRVCCVLNERILGT